MSVGFVGAGRMAQALARGFIAGGIRKNTEIIASTPKGDKQSIKEFEELGCRVTYSNRDLVKKSDVVIMAVKPSVVPLVLGEITGQVGLKHLMISVALGIPISTMEECLPMGSRTVRVMSNTPALVRQGATVFSLGTYATDDDAETVQELFSSVGMCDQVSESAIDAVTGLSGSGPAYCFIAIEALADAGVKQGLPRNLALKLAAQTLLGSAKMVLDTGRHPGALKDDVCSPGGCTIQGVYQLERTGFRNSLMEAVEAATLSAKATSEMQSSKSNHARNQDSARHIGNSMGNGGKLFVNNILQ
ncbi:Pyrroline-5-carboxylate reductase 2 [Halotydeus destructor]|nr:Pyrroline-5-carboxylate reductase 2 [Halotydeus destructor]